MSLRKQTSLYRFGLHFWFLLFVYLVGVGLKDKYVDRFYNAFLLRRILLRSPSLKGNNNDSCLFLQLLLGMIRIIKGIIMAILKTIYSIKMLIYVCINDSNNVNNSNDNGKTILSSRSEMALTLELLKWLSK